MAHNIPYVNQPGSIIKVLEKIKEARVPDRVTSDFLETKLGCKGGAYKQFIPLGKKLGLLNTDGTPTELYKSFRNPDTSQVALGQAIKKGFVELYERNEEAHKLSRERLKGLILEITGLDSKNKIVQLICNTFDRLKELANFEESLDDKEIQTEEDIKEIPDVKSPYKLNDELDLNLSYNINLVLPKTDDPAVFNAIFKSLRENLLRK